MVAVSLKKLKLNGIFEAAQQAADQYLYSIGAAKETDEMQQRKS